MTIEYKKRLAIVGESATIDDADLFWDWLMKNPKGRIDLSACTYLHTVILQLIMASTVKIKAWPADTELHSIMETAINNQGV